MNHEYRNKIANESGIIRVKRAGIMNIEGQMIPLPPPIPYNVSLSVASEAQAIATNLNTDDRTERLAERQAFITLKGHKDNFQNKPTCRLINPAKSEIGRISKEILANPREH